MNRLLNITTHMLGQASGSGGLRHNQYSFTKRAKPDETIRSSSSKGVVALLSGNWAAHVYVNHNWICIGIFKTEEEAEMAYESTINKLSTDSLSKKLDNITQVLNIQKRVCIDGTFSYINVNFPPALRQQKCTRTRLFEKVLTPSDVGELYRIVIPKIYTSCFPCVSDGNDSSSDMPPFSEVAFYDQSMTLWKFRYCIWKGSNSYVFSRGWKKFVREKNLRSKDKVIFFKCQHVDTASVVHTYFAIDVEYNANRVVLDEKATGNRGKSVVTDGEESHLKEGVQNLDPEQNHGGNACTSRLEMDKEADNDLDTTESGKAKERSVMLFGVNIA